MRPKRAYLHSFNLKKYRKQKYLKPINDIKFQHTPVPEDIKKIPH